jgi:hypothetical protein
MWDAFGPLPRGIFFEDNIISLRAWLFDRIVFIPEPLVDYREHDSNIFNRVHRPLTTPCARHEAEHIGRTDMRWRREALVGFGPDLDLAVSRRWITPAMCEEIQHLISARCAYYQGIEEWWNLGWVERLGRFLRLIGSGQWLDAQWCGPRLLPFQTFISLGAVWSRWRLAARGLIARTTSFLSCGLVWMTPVIDSCASCAAG